MSGKGKGKAAEKPAGQRSISAFFSKGPAKVPAAEAEEAPAAKRAKRDDPQQQPPAPALSAKAQGLASFSLNSTPSPIVVPPARERSAAASPAASSGAAAAGPSSGARPAADGTPERPRRRAEDVLAELGPGSAAHAERFKKKVAIIGPSRAARGEEAIPPLSAYTATHGPAGPYTPLEKQIYQLKREHPGVLLMIEVGYKYRFFGEDAQKAAETLNIMPWTDRNWLTASVPVHRADLYVRRLVEAGHKVGVVRQTETAALKAAGSSKSTLFDRKVCGVYTRSTFHAGAPLAGGDMLEGSLRASSYIVAVCEAGAASSAASAAAAAASAESPPHPADGHCEVALCAVEPSTGDVLLGSFRDSALRSSLESHLLCLAPAEVLLAQPLSAPTQKLTAALFGGDPAGGGARVETCQRGQLAGGGGALAAVTALLRGSVGGGSGGGGGQAEEELLAADMARIAALPDLELQALAVALRHLDSFGLGAVLRRPGALLRPLASAFEMQLPPNALRQLDVLAVGGAVGAPGSLLWLVDHCRTPFGRRTLQRWVAHPLRDRAAIEVRLSAVAEIKEAVESGEMPLLASDGHHRRGGGGGAGGAAAADAGASGLAALPWVLSRLPDVERAVTRALHRTATPAEFVSGLSALVSASERLRPFSAAADREAECECAGAPSAALLRELFSAAGDAEVGRVGRALLAAVDREAAAQNPPDYGGLLRTADGEEEEEEGGAAGGESGGDEGEEPPLRFPALAAARASLRSAEAGLRSALAAVRQQLRLPRLDYTKVADEEFLIELPDTLKVPQSWATVSSNKGKKVRRYQPPEVAEAAAALARAREALGLAGRAAWLAFLGGHFARRYALFRGAASALAQLDALCSLGVVACNDGYCRPEVLPDSHPPGVWVADGRHPMLDRVLAGDFVPNDAALDGAGKRCLVITGPNMGGKSVFTRQVALTVILAQLGSFVPARSCRLTVCDGVFTRMGASDSLALGTSTFLEEMSEASAILRQATERSLVVLDELGRGTSTRDGAAIAEATVAHLVRRTRALTLFVTHYPGVARGLQESLPENVACSFAAFVEERPAEGAAAAGGAGAAAAPPRVSFLYKQTPGISPRSFGLNVALLAGVPEGVVAAAGEKAAELERGAAAAAEAAAAAAGEQGGDDDGAVGALLREALEAIAGAVGVEEEGGEAEAALRRVAQAQERAAKVVD